MSSKRKADVHPAVARLAAVAETAKKRGRRPAPAKVIQLPLWPEAKRGAPNAVLRGALFPAIQGKNRGGLLRKVLIATQDGVTIRYTGWQLDQADLTCGSKSCTWLGHRLSAQSVISPPTVSSKLWVARRVRPRMSGLGKPWPGWPGPWSKSPLTGGPTSAR